MVFNLARALQKVIYHTLRVAVKAVQRALREEIEMSREAARIRYQNPNANSNTSRKASKIMSLEEAMMILNIKNLDNPEIETNYANLFKANDKKNGGSFYLQSKIFRAKERIDLELKTKKTLSAQ